MIGFFEASEASSIEDMLERLDLIKPPDALSVLVVNSDAQYQGLMSMSPIDRSLVGVIILRRGITPKIKKSIYCLVGAACKKSSCAGYSLDDLSECEQWNTSPEVTGGFAELQSAWRELDLVKFVNLGVWDVLERECDPDIRSSIQLMGIKYKSFGTFFLERLVYESIAGKNALLGMGKVPWLSSLELKEFARFSDDLARICEDYRRNTTALKNMASNMSRDYQLLRNVAYSHQRNTPVDLGKVVEVLVWLSVMFILKATCLTSTKVFCAAFLSAFRAIECIIDAVLLKARMVEIRPGPGGYSLYIGNDKVLGFGAKWKLVKREKWYRAHEQVNNKVDSYIEYRNRLLLAHGLAHVNKDIAAEFLSLASSFVQSVCDTQVSRHAWQSRYGKLDGVFHSPIAKHISEDIIQNTGVGGVSWYGASLHASQLATP